MDERALSKPVDRLCATQGLVISAIDGWPTRNMTDGRHVLLEARARYSLSDMGVDGSVSLPGEELASCVCWALSLLAIFLRGRYEATRTFPLTVPTLYTSVRSACRCLRNLTLRGFSPLSRRFEKSRALTFHLWLIRLGMTSVAGASDENSSDLNPRLHPGRRQKCEHTERSACRGGPTCPSRGKGRFVSPCARATEVLSRTSSKAVHVPLCSRLTGVSHGNGRRREKKCNVIAGGGSIRAPASIVEGKSNGCWGSRTLGSTSRSRDKKFHSSTGSDFLTSRILVDNCWKNRPTYNDHEGASHSLVDPADLSGFGRGERAERNRNPRSEKPSEIKQNKLYNTMEDKNSYSDNHAHSHRRTGDEVLGNVRRNTVSMNVCKHNCTVVSTARTDGDYALFSMGRGRDILGAIVQRTIHCFLTYSIDDTYFVFSVLCGKVAFVLGYVAETISIVLNIQPFLAHVSRKGILGLYLKNVTRVYCGSEKRFTGSAVLDTSLGNVLPGSTTASTKPSTKAHHKPPLRERNTDRVFTAKVKRQSVILDAGSRNTHPGSLLMCAGTSSGFTWEADRDRVPGSADTVSENALPGSSTVKLQTPRCPPHTGTRHTSATTRRSAWTVRAHRASRPSPSVSRALRRLLLLCVLQAMVTPARGVTVKVGLLHPGASGPKPVGAEVEATARLMVNRLNQDLEDIGVKLTFHSLATGCVEGEGLYRFVQFRLDHQDIKAFVGPSCDAVCHTAGLLAAHWNTTLMSYGCESTRLSNRELYPTFVRTTGTYLDMSRFINAIIRHWKWSKVNIVTIVNTSDVWLEMADELTRNLDLPFDQKEHWSVDLNDSNFAEEVENRASKYRIFILCMYPRDTWEFLPKLQKLGYFRKSYVYITIDYANMGQRLGLAENMTDSFTGLLDVTMDVTRNQTTYNDFLQELTSTLQIDDSRCPGGHYEYGLHASLLADTFQLLAEGIKRTLADGMQLTAEALVAHTINISFPGVTGDVHILPDGSRHADFMLHNLVHGCYVQIARTSSSLPYAGYFVPINSTVVWPGGTVEVPNGLLCEDGNCGGNVRETAMYQALGVALAAMIIVIIVLLVVVFRRRQNVRELGRKDWIIPSDKLFQVPAFTGKAGALTGNKALSSNPRTVSRNDSIQPQTHVSRESLRTFVTGQIFAKVTIIDQQVVAVKPVRKQALVLTGEVIHEVNQIRKLKHTNVNQLMGACVEAGNICLVWGYCSKGSLRDVLHNDNIKLDWIFKFSFISDVAKGMAYIHASPVGLHGKLRSANVVVDSNWACKITDMHMPCFREGETQPEGETLYTQMLWMAPELLRDSNLRLTGTKKGDVFSFAIIMQEIIMRSLPYPDEEIATDEIVDRVKGLEVPPFRPKVPTSTADESILDLMKMCWDEYPLFRPSFATICVTLKKIRVAYGTTSNLVDQMLHMLSKYADHLEELVEERTTQLEEEQKKTEELLCRMLPRSVAQELKLGNPVEPESFAVCTIFFSDIVGFTSLAAQSTPIEVVNMLNDLYTSFDTIIDMYDVYKVETIGDAYMVVSGLPVRNGNQHAGEIAAMALDMLSSVLTFRIRHRPDKQLELRIGIHSGSVVAGVVGRKMPRYCLFGDTVNYASRMESNGLALHIHVSPECKKALDEIGGFTLVERGPVEMKGKGTIVTYFLIGKTTKPPQSVSV